MSNDAQTAGTNADIATATAAAPAAETTLLTGDTTAAATGDQTAAGATAQPDTAAAEAAKAEEKPEGAPETYTEFTAPEGVKFNDEAMTEFKAFAKEKNLSQADAQKLVDLGTKKAQGVTEGIKSHVEQAQAKWAADSRADKEFGGDKLDENRAIAKKALDAYGTPGLKMLLAESGLGNHPELIRAFYRVGKAISEDTFVPGGKAPGNDPLATMYPSMVKT